MMSGTSKAAKYLAENPRTIGVLFTIGLLAMQVTPVLASPSDGAVGP